ncbi:hypothetical protein ATB99_10920 [Elizabethkingia meningoseptica]|uniref:hypothetical protein n=2 Tax=Elizabethkingia meningoseptica TaxID=238 RepID=UPI00035D2562|nr:hypothetical protein [Elizabethkingia meningoseptica]AQX06875.1 hypothetical protein BBD33_17110 [Elizabethkingia meningoseptica]AQX48921.1 hypothetical protein B5G46_17095 [Elizabethkingia meningoseptica]KUY15007.1 hypothetical protein ATB99_10920 [Elizabethkingia meningoseptica]MDE5488453.1 hypothetical protein [Elizabethkingia meningoseptica]MVW92750.1 hypothetical protein [Elizabethkingia meningoseptica]
MKISFLAMSLLLSFATQIKAQEFPLQYTATDISNFASPNAAAFERYNESPINHYNGKANTTIPIYTIKIGNIEYPIALNYSHGGIQVNTISSDVGLGWGLTDTVINRVIVGDADFETFPNPYGDNITCKKNGLSQIGFQEKHGYDQKRKYQTIHAPVVNVDYYPDLFKFFSPNSNSVFFFDRNRKAIELNSQGTKIDYEIKTKSHTYLNNTNNNQCITDFDKFTITTKNGLAYTFDDKDVNHSFTLADNNPGDYTAFGNIGGTFPRVSSWHVSKIRDNMTNEEIIFEYEDYSTETSNDIQTIYHTHPFYNYEMKYPSKISNIDSQCYIETNSNVGSNDNSGRLYIRRLNVKRLKRIIYRGGSVEFNYDLSRQDFTNGKALTSIDIKDYNGKIVNQFFLNYNYFYSDIQKNEFSKRLKLVSVQEKGKNSYKLDYYEDKRLPNIGSAYQDFFGYHNTDEQSYTSANKPYSKYYYYPEKYEYSILPYNITNDNNHYLLNGSLSKEPNENSKTWSLKKISFPTGGSNEFTLESNTFNLWGNTLKGGGTRIQKQILKENELDPGRSITYKYNDNNNLSSGMLFSVPNAGHPGSLLFKYSDTSNLTQLAQNGLENYFYLYTNAKINYDLLNNFFVGYSSIEETEGKKKTVYKFLNNEYPNIQTRTYWTTGITNFSTHCMSGFLFRNSPFGNDIYIDKSHLRGSLKSVDYYDENGTSIIKKTENSYTNYENSATDLDQQTFIFPGVTVKQKYLASGDYDTDFEVLMENTKKYNPIYNNRSYTKVTNFLPNGIKVNEQYMKHDPETQNIIFSGNKIYNGSVLENNTSDYETTEIFYNQEGTSSSLLQGINKLDTPLAIYKNKGDDFITGEQTHWYNISQQKKEYEKSPTTSNLILPKKTTTSFANSNKVNEITNDYYDNKGNLLQTTTNLKSSTVLYGYHQQYPIVKIEGATYEEIMKAFGLPETDPNSYLNLDIIKKSDLDQDQTTESALILALDQFRTKPEFSNFQITTYTYDPLIGITSITLPNGIKQFYQYDTNNKLKAIADVNGNIIEEYEYKYKN